MKTFKENEFACPKHITESGIDKNGQQYISVCVKCRLDNNGICCGDKVVCENNHKQNKYSVYLCGGCHYVKNLKRGKEETLTVAEVLKIVEEYTAKKESK